MRILVLNGGSSSFKCALYDLSADLVETAIRPEPVWKEHTDWTGAGSPAEALEPVLRRAGEVEIVGHRIVHAGLALRATAWITDEVRSAIARNAEVAPAHNRFELEAIDVTTRVMPPGLRQVAVLDTGFHAGLEPAAYVYPGPYEWLEQEGIRRFGFHGISYQYATRRAAQLLGRPPEKTPARMLVCHLGSGASLCAVRDGVSVDTTMGFTPLEGLMMSSRSGSLDPGIIVYLLRHRGYSAEDLDQILNKASGLMGVSGFSGDMRAIQHRCELGDPRAKLAFDVYMRRLTREAGAMVAVLGGLDALVFTGGVGENSAEVRQALCAQLGFLGLRIDPSKNAKPQGDEDLAAAGSSIPVLVIHAEEEWEIARECWRLAKQG
jgi:acetate kinase